jgi:bacillithiol biosynthesis deacetylase BshB1
MLGHVETQVDALFIAPHPDDAELGAGGTIALLAEEGCRVGILDLTDGEPTPAGSPERRRQEAEEAGRILGLTWRGCLGLPNRRLQATEEARWELAALLRQLAPQVVWLPYWEDLHPDHVAAVRLIEDACFWSRLSRTDLPGQPHRIRQLFYYYCVHLRQPHVPTFLIDVTATMEKKLDALSCYRSQFDPEYRRQPGPIRLDQVRMLAEYWGWIGGVPYAEPFTTRSPLLLRDPLQLCRYEAGGLSR